uniref:Probable GTP 3',8-cyclase n=1 Tax=Candidatus Methanomethylicus mesodigestus TaxID=1867258 RepID=A0A7C3IKI0_9CREN
MKDLFGREIRGLRISLTQRCNLNCVYCHHEGESAATSEMTADEVIRILGVAKTVGVRRVKYTGGEPLLRKDLAEIVQRTLELEMDDVAITTNGSLLAKQAQALAGAGLKRMNISLPSINPCVYSSLTKGEIKDTFRGIALAKSLGMEIKINVVIMKGINESEVDELIDYSKGVGCSLQLIELEDLNLDRGFFNDHHIDLGSLEQRLESKADRIEERSGMNGRRRYIFGDSLVVEVVRATNNPHFCMGCTRLRLTSDGKLKPCLMRSDNLVDVLGPIRQGAPDRYLRTLFEKAIARRSPYYAGPSLQ